jgi:uncharacterized membrane protein HdeD (DUF308 family)
LILGFIGLFMNTAMTVATMLYIGMMLIAAGVVQVADLFRSEDGGWAKLWSGLLSLLYIVGGITFILQPGAGAIWMTFFIAAFLIGTGIVRIIAGFQAKDSINSWGWVVASGAISVLLGIMIYAEWPISGLWVIGLFVSIEFIMQGSAMIAIAMTAKTAAGAIREKLS